MAYTATIAIEVVGASATAIYITETDCSATDEAVIPNSPAQGEVKRQICVRISGTCTTVDPILGTIANPAGTIRVVVENETPAAVCDTEGTATYTIQSGGQTLYHRSRPDAGADNVIQSVYHIVSGWRASAVS